MVLIGGKFAKMWQFYCCVLTLGLGSSHEMHLIWVHMARTITQEHVASARTPYLKKVSVLGRPKSGIPVLHSPLCSAGAQRTHVCVPVVDSGTFGGTRGVDK